tara:strand:+ start:182 stop:724 length:543 start_codon:yes stop_codon:yes gene_type:complete
LEITKTSIEGLLILTPKVHTDPRGYFFENFRKNHFEELGIDIDFIQENESMSQERTIRGLHLQAPPHAQDKLIRVIKGSILDIAVDIRSESPTYGQHVAITLSEDNKTSFLVPRGFAHGFYCLENDTIVNYKCSDYYNPESEMGLFWNDPKMGIEWPILDPIVSEKDKHQPRLQDFKSPF